MKTYLIIIFLSILPVASNGQDEYKYIEDIARKGGSFRIIETKYFVNESSVSENDSTMYEFNYDYKITDISNLKLISYPKTIKSFKYNSKNVLLGGDENMEVSFKVDYDFNGLLKSKKYYNKSNKLINSIRYFYDSKNRLKKIKSSINSYQIENLYLNDLLVKSTVTNNSRNKTEIEYNYNAKGNIISEKSYRSLKDSKKKKRYFDYKIEYKYNSENLLIEKFYFPTENISEKFTYTYDENQKLLKWEKFNNQNKVVFVTKYYY